MWLQFLVVQVEWFRSAWLLSVKVAEAAKATHVPRPDHAADATSILARKVTLYQPSVQPSGSIYFSNMEAVQLFLPVLSLNTTGLFS